MLVILGIIAAVAAYHAFGQCSGKYLKGTAVTITATACPGWKFLKWEGACASFGKKASCTITMDADKNVNAVFLSSPKDLKVTTLQMLASLDMMQSCMSGEKGFLVRQYDNESERR